MRLQARDYQEKIFAAKDLPTIPCLHDKLLRLIEDSNYSMDELGRLIETDQVLSSKVLKIVNSPFYGLYSNVASVERAIVLMGSNLIRGLILSTSLFDAGDKTLPGLWDHSYYCSTVANFLALKLNLGTREEIMTGALLHDIGKVLIRKQLPDESKRIDEAVEAGGITMYEAEKRIIDTTHDEIGARLAVMWNLPKIIRDLIASHHRPGACVNHPTEAEVVHLSDIIVKGLGISNPSDGCVPPFDVKGWAALGLPEEDIGDIIGEIIDKMPEDVLLTYTPGGNDGR